MAGPSKSIFQKKILSWFDEHKRSLPWRETNNPYHIWVSEVILQQTRVAQGLPYYLRFIEAFPTVEVLAAAKEDQVLRVWQGLGYYSRARNMHRCAKAICTRHAGRFPNRYSELIQLPGIGPYTAAAISSIAFGEAQAVVDGNVFRVLARTFGLTDNIASPAGKKVFAEKAAALIESSRPGDYNQAIMEWGALQCVPANPDCATCSLARHCVARQNDQVGDLPVKVKTTKMKKRYLTYVAWCHGGKVALRKRMDDDVWHGLYDFYLIERQRHLSLKRIWDNDPFLPGYSPREIVHQTNVRHQLSHQQLDIRFVMLETPEPLALPHGLAYYTKKQALALPKPIVVTRFLDAVFEQMAHG